MRIPQGILKLYKTKYYPGSRVRLIYMNDSYKRLKIGEKGTVIVVDDVGTIHVLWDCGFRLGIAYEEDFCEIIKPEGNIKTDLWKVIIKT